MKSSPPNYAHWVEAAAIELVQRNDLAQIVSTLVAQGCSSGLANKLLLLIPSAFAAEHFEPSGIEFPKHFLVGSPDNYTKLPYSGEPIYVHARQLAQRWQQESRISLIARVLDWSAEANGIKEARVQGKTPIKVSVLHHGFE